MIKSTRSSGRLWVILLTAASIVTASLAAGLPSRLKELVPEIKRAERLQQRVHRRSERKAA
jgi:hypothetical protein